MAMRMKGRPPGLWRVAGLVLLAAMMGACSDSAEVNAPGSVPDAGDPDPTPPGQAQGCTPDDAEACRPGVPVLELATRPVKTFRFSWVDVPGETEYRLLEDPDGASGFAAVATIAADNQDYVHEVFLPERINARYILQACNEHGCSDSPTLHVIGTLAAAVGRLSAPLSEAFGYSVALAADGRTLAVGAVQENSAATGIDGSPDANGAIFSGAAYVFTHDGGSWTQQAYIKAGNAGAQDRFGWSVALSADGDTLAVGAPFEDGGARGVNGDPDDDVRDSGAVYVFTREDGRWSQQAYVKASNAGEGHSFGFSVTLDAAGDTLVAGAPQETTETGLGPSPPIDTGGAGSGAAYVFAREGNSWRETAFIKPAGPGAFDAFGWSVALSGDGKTLAVGTPEERNAPLGIVVSSGAVFVFVRNDDDWTQQASLKAQNPAAFDRLGWSVALSGDGNTLATGATQENAGTVTVDGVPLEGGVASEGAVFVFVRIGEVWLQHAELKASNGAENDRFGYSVALSPDGNTLLAGAPLEDHAAIGVGGTSDGQVATDSGAAYLFVRGSEGAWREQAYLKSPGLQETAEFGSSVALGPDILAIGAVWDSDPGGFDGDIPEGEAFGGGAVYLY